MHECRATGCDRRISLKLLMCKVHWAKVPPLLQREVYRTWARGDGVGSPEYAAAVQLAVAAVAEAEGRAA